jgi:integrase
MAKRLPRGFYWRGGIVWVRTDPITRKPLSTRCKSISAAQLWHEERERLAASPHYAASLSATVGRWVNKTLAHKRARDKSEGTLHMYQIKLGHVARIFGPDSPMAVITPGAVEDYIGKRLEEGVVNNTVSRELTCLRQMLKLARRAGEFALAPEEVMPVDFSAEYTPVKRTMPADQLSRLLQALPEPRRAWIAYLVATAGDVSDVERAQPEDFDPVAKTVFMHGTKNPARNVAIPLLPWFEEMFLWAHSQMPFDPWPRVSKDLPEITARLGLGHITPKDLRRSVATWLIDAGVAESLVSRFLRHRSGAMVRLVYGQVQPTSLGRLILDELSRNVTVDHRAPWRNGRRGGFKRHSGGPGESQVTDTTRLLLPSVGATRPRLNAGTLQSARSSRGAMFARHALAFAAERVGVLP